MRLLDLLNAPWALTPAKLFELQSIYTTHTMGEKIDIAAIEARIGAPLANSEAKYTVFPGGVAVLPIEGVLAPKANLFMQISGGASTQMLTKQLQMAMQDPHVTSIILAIDSPGGSVFGTPEFGQVIRDAAQVKPIVSVAEATMASAAYWVGSAANAVYISGPTVQVGSIGVVATHNYSPAASTGKVTTEITAGKYKRMASGDKPLTAEGQAYLQGQVDHLYSVFVDAVAANRMATTDQVLQHMADGRVFIGSQAINAGLVDGVSTVQAMADTLASNPAKFKTRHKAVFAVGGLPLVAAGAPQQTPVDASIETTPTTPASTAPVLPAMQNEGTTTMNRDEFKAAHPALFAALQSEFCAAGATAERDRIAAVRAQSLPGHEALIEGLAFDGKTTGPEAAQAVLAAERTLRAGNLKAFDKDAAPVAKSAAAPEDKPTDKAQLVAQAEKLAAEKGIDLVAAFKQLGIA